MWKVVVEEFKEYCGDIIDFMWKKLSLEDLVVFFNRIFVYEVEIWCFMWMVCLKGVCNVKELVEENGKVINFIVLLSVVVVKCRNFKMFLVVYCIFIIFFYSGVKYEDLWFLNKLGVCMLLDLIVEF